MTRRLRGRGLLVAACLLAFVGTACTPDPPPNPPSPTASPTPTENAQEREERLAYEAAEKSYRDFRVEYYAVLAAGGSNSATAVMKRTAAGPYLKEATEVVQAYKGLSNRSKGSLAISDVRRGGYSPVELVLRACEDSTRIVYLNAKGKESGRGELRIVELSMRNISGTWKVWSGTGKKVTSCAD